MGFWLRSLCACPLLVASFGATPAVAQEDLEAFLLADVGVAGFAIAPAGSGLPNGPVGGEELRSLLPPDVPKRAAEFLDDLEVVARSWVNGRGAAVIILLYRLPDVSSAEKFFGGFARAAETSERVAESFPVPRIGGAIGQTLQTNGVRVEQVAFGRAEIIAQIGVVANDTIGRPQALQIAESQAEILPGIPTAQAEEESAAYQIGRVIGSIAPLALIAAIIIWFARRRRRAATALPDLPAGPPPIPPTTLPPPVPPQDAGDRPPGTPPA